MNGKGYDMLLKIVIVGNSGIGKTSVVHRFTKNLFSTSTMSTLGVDLEARYINIEGKVIQLQIWDTSGQEKFKSLAPNYYRGAHGIIYMYDITNHKSFDDVEEWIKQVDCQQSPHPEHVSIIVGNKNDCELRCVTLEEIEKLATKNNMGYTEVSAKTGTNIDDVFFALAQKLLKRIPFESVTINKGISLDSSSNETITDQETKPIDSCC